MAISKSALHVLAVTTAVAMARSGALQSNSSRVGCSGAPPAKPGHGYRDGRCGGCECCPLRWSCLEMHSRGYRCAERSSVPVQQLMLPLAPSGRWTVGDAVEASLSDLRWTSLPNCHSHLPPGVHLELNASSDGTSSALLLRGILGYDPTRPREYSWTTIECATGILAASACTTCGRELTIWRTSSAPTKDSASATSTLTIQ
eukprot:COSAG03_NODE_5953_length_1142_cov_1.684564_2_plen_202_part_00